MRMRKVDFEFLPAQYMVHAQIKIGERRFNVHAGNDDDVTIYQDKFNYYVVSENHRLDYIGLERFNKETLDREFDIFFQTDDGSGEKDWLLSISRYPTKIRFMLQWDM